MRKHQQKSTVETVLNIRKWIRRQGCVKSAKKRIILPNYIFKRKKFWF
ncbi:MAG: hypothetical protein MRERV_3c020 [Mycoplasmataceae bacterium RV_VA103A]|nr:MAG: hypothetical protein MRERV_3c020 [Mycoplasmataceae bacterium RV_VA103A]